MKKYYFPSNEIKAPLSGAVEVDGIVYVSGQIHADDEWNIIGETVEKKLDIILKRIKKILAKTGLDLNDVFRVHLYMTDLSELPALNKAYSTYFKDPMPVRTAVGVQSLPLGANLEIDVIATK